MAVFISFHFDEAKTPVSDPAAGAVDMPQAKRIDQKKRKATIANLMKICNNICKQMDESGVQMEKHSILEHYFGYREFRPGQEEVMYPSAGPVM